MDEMIGLLNDREILRMGAELVDPFDPGRVQPASYDLTLDRRLLLPKPYAEDGRPVRADLRSPELGGACFAEIDLRGWGDGWGDGWNLRPGGCVLGATAERVICPADIAARVEGRSSLGRLFLSVHVTAGWIDPGWPGPEREGGQVTLEIVNHGPWSVVLYAGMRIAQVNFTRTAEPSARPYGSEGLGSHYAGQGGVRPAAGGQR